MARVKSIFGGRKRLEAGAGDGSAVESFTMVEESDRRCLCDPNKAGSFPESRLSAFTPLPGQSGKVGSRHNQAPIIK